MDKKKRFTLMFVAGCVAVGIAACIAITLGMIRLIWWYLANCGESTGCSAANWMIDYWWLIFMPACLVAAVGLRRLHDKRYARLPAD